MPEAKAKTKDCDAAQLVREYLGETDIYLLDQILKSRFEPAMRILDAGCGDGRNLTYFLRCGYLVYAVDSDASAVRKVRALAQRLAPQLPESNIVCARIEELPARPERFDAVLCIAVLHFARNRAEFESTVRALWEVLLPGGIFFARLASRIGLDASHIVPLGENRFRLRDGSERYLVSEEMLRAYAEELGGVLLEPIKTVNVQNLRCMTTWCLAKEGKSLTSVRGGTTAEAEE